MNDRLTIAAMALQGILSNPENRNDVPDIAAESALAFADKLIQFTTESALDPETPAADHGAPTLRDLGVPGRAVAPLERMGVCTLAQLAVQARKDVADVKGVSAASMKVMDDLLKSNSLSWEWSPPAQATPTEKPEDDVEDVL